MVEYSVDTNPRLRVYFAAAAASVGIAGALSTISIFNTYRFAAPSAFVIFGALLWIFERCLWRLPVIRYYSGISYLGGSWQGTLTRVGLDVRTTPETHQVSCRVTQSWRKMDFVFEGETSVSSTRIVGLFVENPDHIVVRYIYTVRPRTMLQPSNLSGDGVTELRFHQRPDGDYLEGIYYSDKLRRGDIQLRRIQRGELAQLNRRVNSTAGEQPSS